jgi:hypothetical protein
MNMKLVGVYRCRHIRDGVVLREFEAKNAIVNDGKNVALGILFGTTTKISTWYVGLMATATTLSLSDTLASHTGWTVCSNMGARQALSMGTATSNTIRSSANTTHTATGADTIIGAFIASTTDDTGTLWSSVEFDDSINVVSTDTFQVSYSLTFI